MGFLHHRPLATVCLLFLLAATATAFLTEAPFLACILALSGTLFGAVALLLRHHTPRHMPRPRLWLCLSMAAAILLGTLFGALCYLRPVAGYREQFGTRATVAAHVTTVATQASYRNTYCGEIRTVDGAQRTGLLVFSVVQGDPLEIGDVVQFSALLLSPQDTRVADEAVYWQKYGPCAVAEEVTDLCYLGSSPTLWDRIASRTSAYRLSLSRRLRATVGQECGALMSAMLLNEREGLPLSLRRDMRRTGLSHLLALSGLHLSLFSTFLAWLMRLFPLPRRTGLLAEMALILLYMTLVGLPLSVCRAGIMLLLSRLSFFAAREADAPTSLLFGATLIVLVDHAAVYDVSLWLSVLATLGILLWQEWHLGRTPHSPVLAEEKAPVCSGRFRSLLRRGGQALAITGAATLATLPLSSLTFGEFSLLSPLTNLLLSPLACLYLFLSFLCLPLLFLPPVSGLLDLFGRGLIACIRGAADIPGCLVTLQDPLFLCCATAFTVLLLLCLFLPLRPGHRRPCRILVLAMGVCLLATAIPAALPQQESGLYYQADGNNETLLAVSGGKAILCDLTGGSYTALSDGMALLQTAHLTELEGLCLTHYHTGHLTSVQRLLSLHKVRHLYLPVPQSEEQEALYRALCQIAADAAVEAVLYPAESQLSLPALTIQACPAGTCTGSTHPVLVLRFQGESTSLLYVGSGAAAADTASHTAAEILESDALFFGRHGPHGAAAQATFRTYPAALQAVWLPDVDDPLPDPQLLYWLQEHGLDRTAYSGCFIPL